MRFLFEIVFPLKPDLHIFIFKDFKSFKWRVCIFLKTVSVITVSLLYPILNIYLSPDFLKQIGI